MIGNALLFTIARTGATDEELAAVVAVLRARASSERLRAGSDRPLAGGWKSYYRTIRQQAAPGQQAWRTSIRF